jgi:acetyl-CoA carboxylase biotin carboxyl carrier protein
MTDIKPQDIEAILQTFEASAWDEMKLRIDGLELFVSKTAGARPPSMDLHAHPSHAPGAAHAPVAAAHAHATAQAVSASPAAVPDGWIVVRAPNLGTFYRAPKPGAPAYVMVGQRVDSSTELCLIEVMKLFTSVLAGASGIVRKVLVEDSELVEYDQPLFLIEPVD